MLKDLLYARIFCLVVYGDMTWMIIANVETACIGKERAIQCQVNATDMLQEEYPLRIAAILMTGQLPMKMISVETLAPALQKWIKPENLLKLF
jgi:hypothetical protein